MAKKFIYYLTAVAGFPLIIKTNSISDMGKLAVKGAQSMNESVFNKNKRNWTDEVGGDAIHIAQSINDHLKKLNLQGDYECWLRKEDASDEI